MFANTYVTKKKSKIKRQFLYNCQFETEDMVSCWAPLNLVVDRSVPFISIVTSIFPHLNGRASPKLRFMTTPFYKIV